MLQGFPLSAPFIFLFIIKALSRNISFERNLGNLHGVNITKEFSISQITFVDVILIFGRVSIMEAKVLQHILILFSSSTSMKVNMGKPTILFFNIPDLLKQNILNHLPYIEEDSNSCFKYLGFSLKANDYKIKGWLWFLENIKERIGSWFHQWISLEGRFTMGKSVIESILVYWMAMAFIPKYIISSV